ncbi:hypothetical protein HELRODRAFT_163054 [Helobdella robusta]|uniref:polynucleotide adenylyltransferase n=1 Tax=Helobdella robusta TaxID=6412 RepID=T1ETL9_HELRO|nr:hypothetical protein HELRODRAFT_163054 [Helobdella robusta]ESN96028.1 hypothetical protein HELRODRAFT_163054 [Helobdella robusta]
MSHAVLEYHSRGFETHRYVYSRMTSCNPNNFMNPPFTYNNGNLYNKFLPQYASQIAIQSGNNGIYIPNQIYSQQFGPKKNKKMKGLSRLDSEIGYFCKCMEPTETANKERENVVTRIRAAVESCIDPVKVEVFGSFKTGLYLPSSDIDIVVFHKCPVTPFDILKKALVEAQVCDEDKILVLYNATVPIIKLMDRQTDVKVDIGFNIDNATKSAIFITASLNQWTPMKSLLLVLKQLLIDKDLNEVYSGGISSYSLTLLILYYLELTIHPNSVTSKSLSPAALLLDFLEYFAYRFDYRTFGIGVSPCCLLHKPFVSDALVIRDPLCPSNDVARGSYRFSCVQSAFKEAYNKLHMSLQQQQQHQQPVINSSCSGSSILGCIIRECCDLEMMIKNNLKNDDSLILQSISSPPSPSSRAVKSSSLSTSSENVALLSDDDNDCLAGSLDSGISGAKGNRDGRIEDVTCQSFQLTLKISPLHRQHHQLQQQQPPPQHQSVSTSTYDENNTMNREQDTAFFCYNDDGADNEINNIVINNSNIINIDCCSQQNRDSPDVFTACELAQQPARQPHATLPTTATSTEATTLTTKRSYRDVVCHSTSQQNFTTSTQTTSTQTTSTQTTSTQTTSTQMTSKTTSARTATKAAVKSRSCSDIEPHSNNYNNNRYYYVISNSIKNKYKQQHQQSRSNNT